LQAVGSVPEKVCRDAPFAITSGSRYPAASSLVLVVVGCFPVVQAKPRPLSSFFILKPAAEFYRRSYSATPELL
jgi:hypothetical protein